MSDDTRQPAETPISDAALESAAGGATRVPIIKQPIGGGVIDPILLPGGPGGCFPPYGPDISTIA